MVMDMLSLEYIILQQFQGEEEWRSVRLVNNEEEEESVSMWIVNSWNVLNGNKPRMAN